MHNEWVISLVLFFSLIAGIFGTLFTTKRF